MFVAPFYCGLVGGVLTPPRGVGDAGPYSVVIAEGVETEQQKVMLQGFGCNKAQGYFYARPMREAEYTELLRKEKTEN